ncbi:hypothetical protein NA57DRAFT_81554 [Rhizodiscina lignyota]|uniref:Uncharacterized protein n=1 Tax=Rhizodiscina lignyota TaxID=1504668 RepID=A0A9P4I4W5_9PEZI|nr:hypothetical protein NA57DRAFT_81554 [Rhizodiscina lignyota]
MSSASSAVAWAVPIRMPQLGAHLQAHLEAKPVLNLLRLCHRFGTGPNNHLPKLPQELLDMIIAEYMSDARKEYVKQWNRDFECYEETCRRRDHIPEEEHQDYLDVLGTAVGGKSPTSSELSDQLADIGDPIFDAHYSSLHAWSGRICQHEGGAFAKYDKILRKEFGLEAFIAAQRIPDEVFPYLDITRHRYVSDNMNTIIAFLMLPSHVLEESFNEADCAEADGEFYEVFSTMSMCIDPATLALSEEQKGRFERAMRVLELDVFVHIIQLGELVKPSNVNGLAKKTSRTRLFTDDFSKLTTKQKEEKKTEIKEMKRNVEESQWPKLLSMVKYSSAWFL